MIAALLAVLAPASPSASPASVPSAVAIFDRAFARLGSYPVAPYVVFVATRSERITSPIPGAASSRNFVVRYALRSSDGGENAAMYPLPGSGLPPALIVTSDEGPFVWSIRHTNVRAESHASTLPDVPDLKVIARVVAYAPPDYAIDDAGVETVQGRSAYHLRLRPLSDPQRHNLRDLWVDTRTFDLLEARYVGTYRPTPSSESSPSEFTASFTGVGKYWLVTHSSWTWQDYRSSRTFYQEAAQCSSHTASPAVGWW